MIPHAQVTVFVALQFLQIDFTDVAQQMGGKIRMNVIAQAAYLNIDPRQIVTMTGNRGQCIAADIPFDQDRLEWARAAQQGRLADQVFGGDVGIGRKSLKGLVQRTGILQTDVKVKRGPIIDQQRAVAIVNEPAGGIDALEPDTVVKRQPSKFRALDDLQVKQSRHQHHYRQRDRDHQPQKAMAKPFTVDRF